MQKKRKGMTSKKEEKNNKPKLKKNISLKQIEESSLEEMIEEEKINEFELDEFQESITPVAVRAPVLEKIRNQIPIREEISLPEQNQKQRERRIDYAVAQNEPKYSTIANPVEQGEKKYETNFTAPVLTRRGVQGSIRQEFLKPTDSLWMNRDSAEQSLETDFIEEQRGMPFENEQKKYKRFKLR